MNRPHGMKHAPLEAWPWVPTPVECAFAELVSDAQGAPHGYSMTLHVIPEQALKDPRDRAAAWLVGTFGNA